MSNELKKKLREVIRTIPDYPHEGILFRDITTLLGDAEALRRCIDALVEPFTDQGIDHVAGIEARGFVLGGAMAHQLGCGFIPIRKKGKLPHDVLSVEYSLEYGTGELEVHRDALEAGNRVLLVDDLIATGGTAIAGIELLNRLEAEVIAACFVIDLPELGGSARLRDSGITLKTLVDFEGK